MVVDKSTRFIKYHFLWEMLGDANTKVRIRTTEWSGTCMADPAIEFDLIENLAPEGHIGTDKIPYRSRLLRQTSVRAANHPVKLIGEPGRATGGPQRFKHPSDTHDSRVVIARAQHLQPVRRGDCIVVQKCNNVTACHCDAGI